MKKNNSLIFSSLMLLTITSSCSHEESPILLKKIQVGGKYGEIQVKQSFSNATTNESIQLWAKERQLSIFERYDIFERDYILNDSLFVILIDTSGYKHQKDTLAIKL